MDAIESSWCSGLPTARVAGGSISPYITFSLPKQETKNACFRLTPPQLPVPAIGFIHKNNKTNNARKTIKKPILVPKVSFVPSVNELNGDEVKSLQPQSMSSARRVFADIPRRFVMRLHI